MNLQGGTSDCQIQPEDSSFFCPHVSTCFHHFQCGKCKEINKPVWPQHIVVTVELSLDVLCGRNLGAEPSRRVVTTGVFLGGFFVVSSHQTPLCKDADRSLEFELHHVGLKKPRKNTAKESCRRQYLAVTLQALISSLGFSWFQYVSMRKKFLRRSLFDTCSCLSALLGSEQRYFGTELTTSHHSHFIFIRTSLDIT